MGQTCLAEYYFDMETTGFDFDKDEIITIQWQRVDGLTGEPIGELDILEIWEHKKQYEENAEKEMIKTFVANLRCKPFDFIFVGKNMLFDFCLLNERLKKYNLDGLDLRWLYERVSLDLKPILVIMNNGNFIGYDRVLPKTNPIENKEIPELYRQGKYEEIIQYVKDEVKDFLNAYRIFKKEIPKLKNLIWKGS